MKKHTWIIFGVVGLAGCLWLGTGLAQAQVGMTVTIFQPTSPGALTVQDTTSTWLPEPGQEVYLDIIVGVTHVTSLPTVAMTNYPGQCTNTNNSGGLASNAPDFTLDSSRTTTLTLGGAPVGGFKLTPTDCGGSLTLGGSITIPADSDNDGLPDAWEALYCTPPNVICLNPLDDTDGGPPSNLLAGDGISVFDEYRGFMVSPSDLRDGVLLAADPTHAKHIRTDPRQKDLFIHLVNNNSCADTNTHQTPLPAVSYLGGALGGKKTYPTDGTKLFDNLNTLISGTQIHLLGYTPNALNNTTDQWVDRFLSMRVDVAGKNDRVITYTDTTTSPPPDDRQINLNAVHPLPSAVTDPVTGAVIGSTLLLKGIRLIECLDNMLNPTTYGYAGYGPPLEAGRAFLYTQRIVDHVNSLIALGGTKPLQYLTSLDNGSTWTPIFIGAAAPIQADKDVIISKFMQYVLAMELGHAVKLTPTQEGTKVPKDPTKYQYHHAPKTGSNLDVDITTSTSSAFNKFYVPSAYNTNDETSFIATKKP